MQSNFLRGGGVGACYSLVLAIMEHSRDFTLLLPIGHLHDDVIWLELPECISMQSLVSRTSDSSQKKRIQQFASKHSGSCSQMTSYASAQFFLTSCLFLFCSCFSGLCGQKLLLDVCQNFPRSLLSISTLLIRWNCCAHEHTAELYTEEVTAVPTGSTQCRKNKSSFDLPRIRFKLFLTHDAVAFTQSHF